MNRRSFVHATGLASLALALPTLVAAAPATTPLVATITYPDILIAAGTSNIPLYATVTLPDGSPATFGKVNFHMNKSGQFYYAVPVVDGVASLLAINDNGNGVLRPIPAGTYFTWVSWLSGTNKYVVVDASAHVIAS